MTNTTENHAEQQAAAQLSSIREMLAAVAVDYDRLEELRAELADAAADGGTAAWAAENPDEAAELAELEAAAGDCTDEDDARQRIQDDPLSVQVRSGWYSPGPEGDDTKPEEFEILLCTGGPAVRIMGDLDEYGQPTRAYLQYQDWGTPWTDHYEAGVADTLLEYSQHFFFGS